MNASITTRTLTTNELHTPNDVQHHLATQSVDTTLRTLLVFAIAYAFAFKYGSSFSEHTAAPLWFPDSVLLCALLLSPRRLWPWYLLVGAVIRLMNPTVPVWFLAATYLNDGSKAILSAYFLQRMIRGPVRLNTLRQFGIYIAIAVVGIPFLSAMGGAAVRLPLGDTFWHGFNNWFLGDVTAAVVLTPTLLYWCLGGWHEVKVGARLFFPIILALALTLYFIFLLPHFQYSPILLYAPLPLLILAATTLRSVGIGTAISMLALVSILSAVQGRGAFFMVQSQHSVLSMQLFLIVVSVPMLFVAILIEERKAVETQLSQSEETLRANYRRSQDLAGKVLNAQEEERRRIGRELHDDIGQRLSLLAVELQQIKQDPPDSGVEVSRRMDELWKQASEISNDVQVLSHELHSGKLEYLGIAGAMRGFCVEFSEQQSVEIDFRSHDLPNPLPSPEVSLSLFRVLQEALHNASKHSGVRHFEVELRGRPGEIDLTVSDSGSGFDVHEAEEGRGLGLTSMRERVKLVNGELSIESQPNRGTTIRARVSLGSQSDSIRAAG
jgi:signal transduction histidine kinase